MKKNEDFGLEIQFLNHQSFETRKAQIFINIDESDDWFQVSLHTIGAYKRILIKVNDLVDNSIKYFFLKNSSILIKEKEVVINSLNKKRVFQNSSNKKLNYKNQIKELKKEILYLESMQKIGVEINDYIKLENFKDQLYIYSLSDLLNLKEVQSE